MTIALEDNYADVIRKAQRGLGLSDAELAERAGIPPAALHRVKAEAYDETVLRSVAPLLGLNPRALTALPTYRPDDVNVPGLVAFCTAYRGGMLVNSYLVWDTISHAAAAFDTGADCAPLLQAVRAHNLALHAIFITHTHGDHITDLDRLRRETGAVAFVSSREPLAGAEAFEPGREFSCGSLRIGTRLTWGHSRGGTTYVIHGLPRSVALVGDAVFAGSMGSGMVSYADALRTNREEILTLPPETVLCPGHGPLTTVAEEREHNPFFA